MEVFFKQMRLEAHLLALLLASLFHSIHAAADCGNSNSSATSTINNAADATALASACPTSVGQIILAPDSTGDINFDGLLDLQGSLNPNDTYGNFTGSQITSLTCDTLLPVTENLAIYTAPLLEYISFSSLQSVGQSIFVGDAPVLTSIDLSSTQSLGSWLRIFNAWNLTDLSLPYNASGVNAVEGIGITETALTSIDGFTSTPGAFYLINNYYLDEVTIEISKTTVVSDDNSTLDGSGDVIIGQPSAYMNVSLPYLSTTAGNLEIDNCSSLDIPALYSVNGSFTMQNATFQYLEAPNLGIIEGSLNITGSFIGIESFPALSRIGGDVYIQSSEPIDCTPFEDLSASSKIGGTLFCQGGDAAATSAAASPTSSLSSSSLSTGAKAGIGVGVALGVLLVIGIAVAVLVIRRKRQRRQPKQTQQEQEQKQVNGQSGAGTSEDMDTMKTSTTAPVKTSIVAAAEVPADSEISVTRSVPSGNVARNASATVNEVEGDQSGVRARPHLGNRIAGPGTTTGGMQELAA